MLPSSDSPKVQACQIAAQVDVAFASTHGRATPRQWREEFEREIEEYGRRFDEAEAAYKAAKKTAIDEYMGFLEGKCKRLLTNPEKSPKDGLKWIKCVAEIPISTSVDRPVPGVARITRGYALGTWATPEVYRRKQEGREPPPCATLTQTRNLPLRSWRWCWRFCMIGYCQRHGNCWGYPTVTLR